MVAAVHQHSPGRHTGSTPTTAHCRGPPRGVSHSRLDTADQGREMGVLTLQNMAIHPSGATFESFAKKV